jgi:hypothetical protein
MTAQSKGKATSKRRSRKRAIQENPIIQKIKKRTEQYENANEEIQKQYRDIIVGGFPEDMKLRLRFPSPGVESSCNKTYSRIYGQLFKDDDFLTEKEIIEKAIVRGVWSEAKEDEMKLLQEKVSKVQAMVLLNVDEGMTEKEIEDMANEFEKSDEKLNELIAERFALTSNALEVRCQEVKIKDQVWQCVVQVLKDGSEEPLWNSLEEIEREVNRVLVYRCINECIQYWQGLPSDFLDDSPGNQNGDTDITSVEPQEPQSSENQ